MPSIAETVKPAPVPRCPEGHHPHKAGCKDCRKRAVYLRAVRIWERANGIETGYTNAAVVQEHLNDLIQNGNRTAMDIAAESGLDSNTVRDVLYGRRTKMFAVNARALLDVKPAEPKQVPLQSNFVPATEGVRLLRGMFAQGWSWSCIADLLGGVTKHTAQKIAAGNHTWMLPETLHRIRAVARELGRYDIRRLDKPLRGMDIRCANRADFHGWHTLSAWRGLDISDPAITPDVVAEADDTEDDHDMGFFRLTIDRELRRRVQESIEKIKLEWSTDWRYNRGLWITAPGVLNTLQEIVVWWLCDHAGLSDAQTARIIGYPADDEKQIEAGQRQMMRLQGRYRAARVWIDSDPSGETPDWYTPTPSKVGSRNFSWYLPVLIALHDAPFGAGWDLYELAKRCGVTEDEMVDYLAAAQSAGDMLPRRTARILNQQRHRGVPGARAA